jgi:hypothetical protein
MALEGDDDLNLEDAIGAALDDQGAEPKKPAADDPFPRSEDLRAGKEDSDPVEYVREGRRFVRKNGKETDVGAADAPKEAAPLWFKNEYGEWEKLNPDFRKALAQREKDFAQGIEKHSTVAKQWEPIAKMIEPHAQQLAAMGSSPQQYVTNLIQADAYLRQDPVQAINWLIGQYIGQGHDVRSLADWMDQQGVQANKVDPVQQELQALKAQVQYLSQMPVQQQQETINRTVSEWSKDKPHFAELERIMLGQIQADPDVRERFRANPTATLDSLYEQASWAHPVIRERILADQRKADVQRARANSLGTREQSHTNGQARNTPKMSIEDEIGSLLDGAI